MWNDTYCLWAKQNYFKKADIKDVMKGGVLMPLSILRVCFYGLPKTVGLLLCFFEYI